MLDNLNPEDCTISDRPDYSLWQLPKNKWSWALTPDDSVRFHVPNAPNWFHRLMQRLILGIDWKPLEEMSDG